MSRRLPIPSTSSEHLPAPPARWPWTPLLKASAALHGAAGAAVVAQPGCWPWALGAVALDHAVITGAGLWPRSTCLGANLRRLPEAAARRGEIALTIDDGPAPQVTPAVLDLLDAHAAKATFFCIAAQAERHAALCREIVRRGHSVQNHSHAHSHAFSLFGPAAMAREVARAQAVLAAITGERPRFFRAPAGLRNPFLAAVLHRLDLQLVSWTRRGFDTRCAEPATVLRRLTRQLRAGDILLLHDGHAAVSSGPVEPDGPVGLVGPDGPDGLVDPVGLVGPVGQVGPGDQLGQVSSVGPVGQGGSGDQRCQESPATALRPSTSSAPRTARIARGGQPVILDVLPPLLRRFELAGLRAVTLDDALNDALHDAPPAAP